MALLGYLFVVSAGVLLSAIWQVSGALSQMHPPGKAGTDALGFPVLADRNYLREVRESWSVYLTTAEPADSDFTRKVVPPQSLVNLLFWLDLMFVVCYVIVLGLLLMLTHWALQKTVVRGDALADARLGVVRFAFLAIGALAVVDLLENVALWGTYVRGWDWVVAQPIPIGPALSFTKMVLAALVLLGLLVAGGLQLVSYAGARQAAFAARGVLIVVALCWILLSMRIGADQVDDVIRAWNWPRGILAVLAAGLATLGVAGSIAELTDQSVDRPDPEHGDSPLPLLGLIGVALVVLGGVMWWAGAGWGLIVPGVMVLLLTLASVPFERAMKRNAEQDSKRVPSRDHNAIRRRGRQLARLTGAGLTAVLIWVVARAGAFDLLVRQERVLVWVQPVVIAALLLIGGLVLVSPARLIWARWMWPTATAIALVLLLATLVPSWSVRWPEWWGTLIVLLLGVAAGSGLLCAVVVVTRSPAVRRRRLAPALWAVRLRRFPAVVFVVVWLVLIEVIPARAGFHDIEISGDRTSAGVAPPTLEQAYSSWLAADPRHGAVRPMVLVGAQGGGIRAAVWTALVMECVFGTDPVPGTHEVCAGRSQPVSSGTTGAVVNDTALPVFLASGASGGSVGLAAWTARRADQVAGVSPPASIDTALSADFVAPDFARLLTGDLAHMFLVHHGPDRASVFEHALAGDSASGPTWLSRGLRATWQLANSSGKWRIPVLALNGFQVGDGCRLVVSPVDFDMSATGQQPSDELDTPTDVGCGTSSALIPGPQSSLRPVLPRTTELIDYLCPGQDISLATAGHLSARFPYVSPAARVARQDCGRMGGGLLPAESVSYVLDGGIYDNSGATTAQEAWRALSARAAAQEKSGSCVVPIFLQIDNSVDDVPPRTRRPPELLAPLQALFQEIGSREAVARTSAAIEFGRALSPAGFEVKDDGNAIKSLWFRIALSGQPGPQPPLGWTLAESTIKDMRAQLLAEGNKTKIAELRRLLTSQKLTCGDQPQR